LMLRGGVMERRTNLTLRRLAAELARLQELIISTPRLHRKELMLRYGCSESTLHRWIRKNLLPAPVRFTGPLWRLADLEAAEASGQLPRPDSA
jgi:predicted DNA-binding transcriptional regulator AlpA